jgi:hypothetical protein
MYIKPEAKVTITMIVLLLKLSVLYLHYVIYSLILS